MNRKYTGPTKIETKNQLNKQAFNSAKLSAKNIFGMENVKADIEIIVETEKAIKANISAEFFQDDVEMVAKGMIWIPKYIMEKKKDAAKLEWIFANKNREIHAYQKQPPTLAQISAQIDQIEYNSGGVNEDEMSMQAKGIREIVSSEVEA